MKVYKLLTEDLTYLGIMSAHPETISDHLYTTRKKAVAAAEEDYGQKIAWLKDGSGDLRHVMYSITEIKVL